MKQFHISKMVKGWFVGDFTPTAFRTRGAEVALKVHRKGEVWPNHFQKEATEINLVLNGYLKINEDLFGKGDIFVVEPMEITQPEFLTDVEIVCVKVPSIPNDTIVVK